MDWPAEVPGRRYCVLRVRGDGKPQRITISFTTFVSLLRQQLRRAEHYLNTKLGRLSHKKRQEREDAHRRLAHGDD